MPPSSLKWTPPQLHYIVATHICPHTLLYRHALPLTTSPSPTNTAYHLVGYLLPPTPCCLPPTRQPITSLLSQTPSLLLRPVLCRRPGMQSFLSFLPCPLSQYESYNTKSQYDSYCLFITSEAVPQALVTCDRWRDQEHLVVAPTNTAWASWGWTAFLVVV
jgi:hypothetical protein